MTRSAVRGAGVAATIAVIAALLNGCGGSRPADTAHSSVSSPVPTAAPSSSVDARAGLVDIGGGRHLFAECAGRGTPTILLESGDESDTQQWRLVYPALIEHTRTCRYDRLGNGQSDDATGCRELPDLRADLETLLRALGEDGPYVLVGTSGGGYLMAGFAYAHPAATLGMVLVETPHAIIASQSPPERSAELKCDSPTNQEHRDYVRVENAAWSQRHQIGDIPMTIISNNYRGDYQNEEERTNVAGQKGWLVLSPQARQIVVTTGHNVPEDQPELVTQEILRVIDGARAH